MMGARGGASGRGEQKDAIQSKRKKLTVFFSDIAGFTEITQQLESEELTNLLNRYLTEMSQIALEHGATVDKFIGDAIVGYFGDSDSQGIANDALACVRMALAMQERMRELHREWTDMGIERTFELRVGINTGYCTIGNFGNAERMDYTIIGSEVNLAARLEEAADVGGILLANETYSLVKDRVQAEEPRTIAVKGFSRPVKTFKVSGLRDPSPNERGDVRHDRNGLTLHIHRERMNDTEKVEAIRLLEMECARLKGEI